MSLAPSGAVSFRNAMCVFYRLWRSTGTAQQQFQIVLSWLLLTAALLPRRGTTRGLFSALRMHAHLTSQRISVAYPLPLPTNPPGSPPLSPVALHFQSVRVHPTSRVNQSVEKKTHSETTHWGKNMLRSAVGRPGGASRRASTFITCRSHRYHTPARVSPALRPTKGEEVRPTPRSKADLFDAVTPASTRNSNSRTSGGVAVTARRGSSIGVLKFGRLSVGGVCSLARAGKSTATALGEEEREESLGGSGGGGGGLTSFRLTGKLASKIPRVYLFSFASWYIPDTSDRKTNQP